MTSVLFYNVFISMYKITCTDLPVQHLEGLNKDMQDEIPSLSDMQDLMNIKVLPLNWCYL